MKQTDQVLNYLKTHKGITSAEAFYQLGIAHLPRRVADLADAGHRVIKITENGLNRLQHPTHWTRYFISQKPNFPKHRQIDRNTAESATGGK